MTVDEFIQDVQSSLGGRIGDVAIMKWRRIAGRISGGHRRRAAAYIEEEGTIRATPATSDLHRAIEATAADIRGREPAFKTQPLGECSNCGGIGLLWELVEVVPTVDGPQRQHRGWRNQSNLEAGHGFYEVMYGCWCEAGERQPKSAALAPREGV